jgi:hypothetical protein
MSPQLLQRAVQAGSLHTKWRSDFERDRAAVVARCLSTLYRADGAQLDSRKEHLLTISDKKTITSKAARAVTTKTAEPAG